MMIKLVSDNGGTLPKHCRMLDETMIAEGLVSKEVVVKNGDELMEVGDVMEPSVSSVLGSHAMEEIRKVREVMCPIPSFHIVNFRERVKEHKLTHGKSLLHAVDFVLIGSPYNVQRGREGTNSHSMF